MKKQQNKQKLDEMEAAMLAALEEMEVKTTGNGLWEQQEDEVSLSLSLSISILPLFPDDCRGLTINDWIVA